MTIRITAKRSLACCAFLLCAGPTLAFTFCANTVTEIQNALQTSASNGEHDVIRIYAGTYEPTSGGVAFTHYSNENFNLTIEGGWRTVGMTPCGARDDIASLTVLSGGHARPVMALNGVPGSSGAITIRNLTLRNGFSSNGAAGITIGTVGGYSGNTTIERVIIRNNQATSFGAGIFGGSDGGVFRLSNSLLLMNECGGTQCAASLTVNDSSQGDTVRAWITGNTIVLNGCNDAECPGPTGLRIGGNALALFANNVFAYNEIADLQLDAEAQLFNNQIPLMVGLSPLVSSNTYQFADPGFVAPLSLDFRLTPESPLIDQGTAGVVMPSIDLDGAARLNGIQYDVGAFENGNRIFTSGFEAVF